MVKCTLWKSVGSDSLGGPSQTPVLVGGVWAQIVSLRGVELAAAQQINAQINVRISVRYQDVRAIFEDGTIVKMYVQHRTAYYDIQAPIARDQRDQWIDLFCVGRDTPPIFS